jgi:hypothetical protein
LSGRLATSDRQGQVRIASQSKAAKKGGKDTLRIRGSNRRLRVHPTSERGGTENRPNNRPLRSFSSRCHQFLPVGHPSQRFLQAFHEPTDAAQPLARSGHPRKILKPILNPVVESEPSS